MKLIFLDIDGVLNNAESHGNSEMMNRKWHLRLDPANVAVFDHLVKEVGADCRIVMSSSLRDGYNAYQWSVVLRDIGVSKALVVGITPRLERFQRGIYIGVKRGEEIDAWLREHGTPERYIILDDDADMDMHQHRLVQTDCYKGLTMDDVRRAHEMLKGDSNAAS